MPKINTFPLGGIHIAKEKLTALSPIIPEIVYIPIKQHIGSPAKILVNKGDKVKIGTLLADADGIISADIHSSVAGEVVAIEPTEGADGYYENMITIKTAPDEYEPDIDTRTEIIRDIPERDVIIHKILHITSYNFIFFINISIKQLNPTILFITQIIHVNGNIIISFTIINKRNPMVKITFFTIKSLRRT